VGGVEGFEVFDGSGLVVVRQRVYICGLNMGVGSDTIGGNTRRNMLMTDDVCIANMVMGNTQRHDKEYA